MILQDNVNLFKVALMMCVHILDVKMLEVEVELIESILGPLIEKSYVQLTLFEKERNNRVISESNPR
jgi:hypothetical protein